MGIAVDAGGRYLPLPRLALIMLLGERSPPLWNHPASQADLCLRLSGGVHWRAAPHNMLTVQIPDGFLVGCEKLSLPCQSARSELPVICSSLARWWGRLQARCHALEGWHAVAVTAAVSAGLAVVAAVRAGPAVGRLRSAGRGPFDGASSGARCLHSALAYIQTRHAVVLVT